MSTIDLDFQRSSVRQLADSLDVPPSAYKLAIERYGAVARHLEREGSAVAEHDPRIYAQGSFQIGTVVPPVDPEQGYDLDLACEVEGLGKADLSQRDLKHLLGDEVKSYAEAHGMQKPKEKPRCWHLDYRDDVTFHMDIVPAVPEDASTKAAIAATIEPEVAYLAQDSVAITDWDDEGFEEMSERWPTSNPKGYAAWFVGRMRTVAGQLLEARAEVRKAEEVPVYEWKTPLQAVVQIMKRHRNVMFREDPSGAPLSCIITTLAGRAYAGQLDLRDALVAVVEGMGALVRDSAPRVPNPVNPGEDFADKWSKKPSRERAFWRWLARLTKDVARLGEDLTPEQLRDHLKEAFEVSIPMDRARVLAPRVSIPAAAATPSVRIENKPDPWTERA